MPGARRLHSVTRRRSLKNTSSASNDGPLESFLQGFKREWEANFTDVTRDDGRVIACIHAHEDKFICRWENVLYDSKRQFEDAITSLSIVCDVGIEKYCLNIDPGESLILDCIGPDMKAPSKRF